ncbi:MAG: hypothetical protein DU480_07535 [Nitrosomonas sp.]|uniref:SIR2 family protein n=1 Tax=Nitrosomonas sp. TaxID=42353 RepID=UPI0032ECD911
MSYPANPHIELQQAVCEKRVVIIAGTGVSIAASRNPSTGKPHPQASWAGLLQNGLQWLKEHQLIDDGVADAHLKLLEMDKQTQCFISAAETIVSKMGGDESQHFADWLKRTIGSIEAHDRSALDALHDIRQHGNLLATTNYDSLLLGDSSRLNPVTWEDTDALVGAVRQWDIDKIIFLHGFWRRPESVVLDWKSYDRIVRDDQHREDLAAVWKTNAWVYVGCGVNGLSDPDFGLLLERYGQRARHAGHWDYCLVRDDQKDEFQSHFDSKKLNIRAIPFGKDHNNLPQYLRSLLPQSTGAAEPAVAAVISAAAHGVNIPKAPAFYAEPDYIGSHQFVGRQAELDALSDWANHSDPTNLLLFEAIGGNGKSMLTWEWAKNHATTIRTDWAGRFWYSFYERGAIMQDFCQHALAYMTGRPLIEFEKRKTAEMKDELIAQLHARPWLLILDGLERVLVAYHRIDAAEIPDEEANAPTDKILNRNPCQAIRDEDNDLLRALAACVPSKILVSSRLTPHVLLNQAGQPMPGVRRITLPGLRPPDAEKLLRSCGISGDSAAIQGYLTHNCDNHPLAIGVLAGLINDYLPDRGNFDAWSMAADGGAALNLASLDLIQRRNHILRAALDALLPTSRQLLSMLALLSEAVDYGTLKAFNPHLPPETEKADDPAALRKLMETVKDLEQRGLLQYDGRVRRYDLHPVVRGVAAGGMKTEDKESYGQRVVDHFSSLPHSPYREAKTMEDVANGLHVVRILLKLGHYQQAADVYRGDLSLALFFNLEAHVETLSLLRPFFPAGWEELPKDVDTSHASYLVNNAAIALSSCGEFQKALGAHGVELRADLEAEDWVTVNIDLRNISNNLGYQNLLAKALHVNGLAVDLASVREDDQAIFINQLSLLYDQSDFGQWQAAEATWRLLDPMGRDWNRAVYRQGNAEYGFALFQFRQGNLHEEHLAAAATLAEQDDNRTTLRDLHWLRGIWRLEQGEWILAAASFHQAVSMARERRLVDENSETGLALAKFHLGQLAGDDARSEAERLAQLRQPAHRILAMLWLAIGDHERAKKHALAAYRWAWADGEPYVNRYELTKTTELLQQMSVPIPVLPPYDPAKDEPFPWEADVRAAIEKLRAEKAAESEKKD